MSFRRTLKQWIPRRARQWVRRTVEKELDQALPAMVTEDQLQASVPQRALPILTDSRQQLREFQDELQRLTAGLVGARQTVEESRRITAEALAFSAAATQLSERVGARLAEANQLADA